MRNAPFYIIFNWLLDMDRRNKRILQVLFDSIIIVGCYVVAMALRLDGFEFIQLTNVWTVLLIVLPFTIFLFIRFGLYRAVLRYISSRSLQTIGYCVFVSSVTMYLTDQVLILPVPRSVPIIYMFLLFCAVGGSRFLWRALYLLRTKKQKDCVVIYGAGKTGRQLLDSIRYADDYNVVGFLDDNKRLHGQVMGSVKIYNPDSLATLKEKFNIKAILIAIPGATRNQKQKIVSKIEKYSLKLHSIPAIDDLISGKAQINELKDVQVDEVLGRDRVPPKYDLLRKGVHNKIVLITGAGGSIGSELCRHVLLNNPKTILLLDVSEYALYQIQIELEQMAEDINLVPILGSVQNKAFLKSIFKSYHVDTVYHAAAYKHVPLVEQNIVEAIRNNVFGTLNLIETAISAQVRAITLISTDKAVRPTNFMGASKRVAELICQVKAEKQMETLISIVRFGNVLGSSGSVIPLFKQQIKSGGPVTVTHPDVTRFFMTISEAAQLVIQAGAMAKGGDVFVLDMGKPVRIASLAERMIRLHGFIPYFEDSSSDDIENADICIKFTGLRPGEKLYEELLIEASHIGTPHPRIMSASEISIAAEELESNLAAIKKACEAFDIVQITEILMSMPLEFTPDSNSIGLSKTDAVTAPSKVVK